MYSNTVRKATPPVGLTRASGAGLLLHASLIACDGRVLVGTCVRLGTVALVEGVAFLTCFVWILARHDRQS